MNSQTGSGWPPPSASGVGPTNNEHHLPGQQRSLGNFGSAHPMQQGPSSQIAGPPLQSGPFYSAQPNGPHMSNPVALGQGSPLQGPQGHPPFQQQHSPSSIQHQIAAPGYSLPALNSAIQQQQQSAPAIQDLEREHAREREIEMERRQQQEQMAQREYEREKEMREQQRELHHSPLENHTGSITIQQPVASRIPATLHGPNGILNHQHVGASMAPNPPPAPLGAPNGPGNVFANGMQSAREASPRAAFIQQGQQMIPAQQMLNPVGPDAMQQLPAGLSQGAQQPILNDALSYLDQVKVRFVEHPDVYNRFLDIMKDFKSQSIDTPGVIDRVSTLFAGHPELIQGFNTFLPPGYRIECGTQDDPNAIRVTTPMGTMISQMASAPERPVRNPGSAQGLENGMSVVRPGQYSDAQSNGDWGSQQQDLPEMGPENPFGPNGRLGSLQYGNQSAAGQESGMYEREDQVNAAEAAHRQEQRGVSNLSHAASAIATNGGSNQLPLTHNSPSGGQGTAIGTGLAGMNNAGSVLAAGNQLGMEKRGPVEFNHAIGYVNKIKNRFSSQPEIYKSFLEILQTYQRESKPIHDVYGQVTQLFSTAPDLLEDFKQFLPESAAQAKAQQQAAARQATEEAAMLSNVRGDAGYLAGMPSNQTHTPKPEMKMPPVGNFAPPPSTGKESKKRRVGPGQMTGGAAVPDSISGPGSQNNRAGVIRGANSNKRARIEQPKTSGPELPPVSPTLVPSLPRPLPPSNSATVCTDELAAFDRIKKHLGNKQTYNEFLKLCNLFTQQMIDRNTLMHKAYNFFGNNNELLNWFKEYIQYDGIDEIIDNKPRTASSKVTLSNCRGLGPSYRLVPEAAKRDMHCSGRDEVCMAVLNDDWSSFPTWASEDSGFIAHRKNTHEEALSRCEEERHDYDINIEACNRTIQLMEPIVNQIKLMSQEEQRAYKVPHGLGGVSETIYERVIKKIYGRDIGGQVINDMFAMPAAVLPLLVWRLNQKVEEWKASLREWDKIWREQTNKQFWRSLDHQSVAVKQVHAVRQYQPKPLQTEIQTKYEEQRRQRAISSHPVSKYQLEYTFDDVDIIYDVCHLILTYCHVSNHGIDGSRVESFFGTFIPTFFDLDPETFQRRMSDIDIGTPSNEEAEDETTIEDPAPSRGRRAVNGRKGTLLRGVLDRKQRGRDSSAMRDSKETTPDITSMDEDIETPSEETARTDPADHRWTELPRVPIKGDEPFKRDSFNLYASVHIYCFFRLFETCYSRFAHVKANEAAVHEDVRRANVHKPADDLNMADKRPADYFNDVGPDANYYRQILGQCESIVKGDNDANHLEDTLRRFYIQKGWQLYSFEKILQACGRFAMQILVSDNKDKSLEIIHLFYKDRKEDETTHDAEMVYRKQVEKLSKDGDIYRITYSRPTHRASIQILTKDARTFELDAMAAIDRWRYYVSAYTMRTETEGVPLSRLRYPFLHRNMPPMLDSVEEYTRVYLPQSNKEELQLKFSQKTYHIEYVPFTEEWWVHNEIVRCRGMGGMIEMMSERKAGFGAKFGEGGSLALQRFGRDGISQMEQEFRKWIDGEGKEEGGGVEIEQGASDEPLRTEPNKDDAEMTGV